MPRRFIAPARSAWEDKFRTPTIDALLGGVQAAFAPAVSSARQQILTLDGTREALSWQGFPWRWCLSYRSAGVERPWLYLVPHPSRPILVLPLRADAFESLNWSQLSRPMRAAALLAPTIAGVRWTQWDLTSRAAADEALQLVRRAHDLQHAHSAA